MLEFTQRPRAFIYEFVDQVQWLGQCMRLHPEPRKAPKHTTINVCTKLETCRLHAKASPESISPPTTEQVRPASLSQPRPTRARHSQPDPARAKPEPLQARKTLPPFIQSHSESQQHCHIQARATPSQKNTATTKPVPRRELKKENRQNLEQTKPVQEFPQLGGNANLSSKLIGSHSEDI